MNKKRLNGRSMVEMMSFLAIVGILSIAALYGLKQLNVKRNANETINDVSLNVI